MQPREKKILKYIYLNCGHSLGYDLLFYTLRGFEFTIQNDKSHGKKLKVSVKQADLAKNLDWSPATISRDLQKLYQNGYITKVADFSGSGAQGNVCYLTKTGLEYCNKRYFRQKHSSILQQVPEKDKKTVDNIIGFARLYYNYLSDLEQSKLQDVLSELLRDFKIRIKVLEIEERTKNAVIYYINKLIKLLATRN